MSRDTHRHTHLLHRIRARNERKRHTTHTYFDTQPSLTRHVPRTSLLVSLEPPNSSLVVSPTTDGVWLWEPLPYYQSLLLSSLKLAIDPANGTRLIDLENTVDVPTPLRGVKVRDFIRRYPDVFSTEVDTKSSDERRVKLNGKEGNLPTWT